MQDATRVVFDVWPEVRIQVSVDDIKFNVQAGKAEESTEVAMTVFGKLKRETNMRSLKMSLDEEDEGKSKVLYTARCMMKGLKIFFQTEGLLLTCSAEC